MKPHLKYIAGDYMQESDARGINPMSYTDCQVVDKLSKLLKGTNLGDVIDLWKLDNDQDVLHQLQQIDKIDGVEVCENPLPDVDIDAALEGNEELQTLLRIAVQRALDELSILYIKIKDKSFRVRQIYNIATQDTYEDDRPLFNIIINAGPMPQKECWYEDTVIKCFTLDERERELQQLQAKLIKFGLCKFI